MSDIKEIPGGRTGSECEIHQLVMPVDFLVHTFHFE